MGILCSAAAKPLTLFFCLFRENGQLKMEPSTTLPDQESTGEAGTCTSAAPTMWLGAQNGWCVPLGLAELCVTSLLWALFFMSTQLLFAACFWRRFHSSFHCSAHHSLRDLTSLSYLTSTFLTRRLKPGQAEGVGPCC